jgi:hypothetical protein
VLQFNPKADGGCAEFYYHLDSAEMPKHSSQILALARRGADHRYAELKAEIAALIKAFPHLSTARHGGSHSGTSLIDVSAEPGALIDRPRRKRRRMSAAARRKISLAQKRRWAKQKAAAERK